jgi:hypothetical protein
MTIVAVIALGLAGCGSVTQETPAACLTEPLDYLDALDRAPAKVRLTGDVAISGCLVDNQEAGELAEVGEDLVYAATALNLRAQDNPGGHESVVLGYLIGAAQRGAADTGGIHADLIRRLNSAARFTEAKSLPAAFERAFGRGYAAGRADG